MKYLKIYEDFNSKDEELKTMFGLIMDNTEVYKIPYSYYGDRIYNETEKISESNKVDEFMYIVKDKLLELSDIGFGSYLEDENSEPLLGDMVRITIDKERRSDRSFSFSECEDLLSDIILTNKDMKAFKTVHIIITPNRSENHQSIRLEYNEVTGKFHPEGNSNPNLNYVNPLRRVELFFEN